MPVGPSAAYVVTFAGQQLPGYLQTYNLPLEVRSDVSEPLGIDGGIISQRGGSPRKVDLNFLVRSRLDNATGLQHEEDCVAQYAAALALVARPVGEQLLTLDGSSKGLRATFVGAAEQKEASETSHRKVYTLSFTCQPWWFGTAVTTTFSGNGSASVTLPDTRKTYPVFTIPGGGATAFTATHSASGKSLQFAYGAHPGAITIDCGKLTAVDSQGTDVVRGITNVDFGIYHPGGAGSFSVTISGYAGGGSVTMAVYPRLER